MPLPVNSASNDPYQQMEAAFLRQLLSASGAFKASEIAGGHLRADMFVETLADAVATPGFRGCAFYNASSESGEDSVAREIGRLNRDWSRELLTDLAREAGAHDQVALTRQLMIIYDGTLVGARMAPDDQPTVTSRAMVAMLVDAATG